MTRRRMPVALTRKLGNTEWSVRGKEKEMRKGGNLRKIMNSQSEERYKRGTRREEMLEERRSDVHIRLGMKKRCLAPKAFG